MFGRLTQPRLGRLFDLQRGQIRMTSAQRSSYPFPVLEVKSLGGDNPKVKENLARNEAAVARHQKLAQFCLQGGGEKGIARHVGKNKKVLVRDRIKAVLDPGSDLFELGLTSGIDLEYGHVPCAGNVIGIGKICGVDVIICANDATVKGGTSYPITVTKALRAQEIAQKLGLPVLYMVDSGGAFLPLQSEIFPDLKHGGRTFRNQAVMSSQGIPQMALVAGLCTAGGAYTPTMSDEAIMVDKIANIYLGGPPLVKAATGEIVSGEQLGGATLHCSESGIADHFAKNEQESFDILRDIVASLNIEPDLANANSVEQPKVENGIFDQLGGKTVLDKDDIYALIGAITDGSRFSEFKKTFGQSLITGFAKLNGNLVGIVANFGNLVFSDAQKGGHFIQLCDRRDIPLIFLQNSSNNTNAEQNDITLLKEKAKFIQCQSTARVPKVTLNVGGCRADDLYTMCGPSFDPAFYFMWPRSYITKTFDLGNSDLGSEVSDNPLKADLESAQYWTSRCVSDGIVLPSDTRKVLAESLRLATLNYVTNRDLRRFNPELLRGAGVKRM